MNKNKYFYVVRLRLIGLLYEFNDQDKKNNIKNNYRETRRVPVKL